VTRVTDDPGLSPTDALVQLSFLMLGELTRIAAGHELSLTQVRLLGVLRDRRPPMLELARLLELEKSSMTGLINRAEARGLVRRVRDEADGRGVLVELTAAGRELAATAAAAMGDRVDELLADLPPHDRQQLTRLAGHIALSARPATTPR
jgi:MarR family transcriptional regulator, lower aerobic nicotinate degradation pathway regulator